jgi:hypothetical protein
MYRLNLNEFNFKTSDHFDFSSATSTPVQILPIVSISPLKIDAAMTYQNVNHKL